jgi:hypothetical protein
MSHYSDLMTQKTNLNMQSTKLFDADYPNYHIPLDPEAEFFVKSIKAKKKLKPSMTGSKKCYPTYTLYDKCGNQIKLKAHKSSKRNATVRTPRSR